LEHTGTFAVFVMANIRHLGQMDILPEGTTTSAGFENTDFSLSL